MNPVKRKGVPFGTPFSPLSFTSFYINLRQHV